MGMDVFSRKDETIIYSCSIFPWSCILDVMRRAGYAVPDIWECNNGEGLKTQAECDELADLIQRHIDEKETGPILMGLGNEFTGSVEKMFGVRSNGSVSRDRVIRWISFLRECGGFKIY